MVSRLMSLLGKAVLRNPFELKLAVSPVGYGSFGMSLMLLSLLSTSLPT